MTMKGKTIFIGMKPIRAGSPLRRPRQRLTHHSTKSGVMKTPVSAIYAIMYDSIVAIMSSRTRSGFGVGIRRQRN